MVNFEEEIRRLEEKGIFTKEQAQQVSASFGIKSQQKVSPKRSYMIEKIGAFIFFCCFVVVFLALANAEKTQKIEDISQTLNAPISSGISFGDSFILIVLFVVVFAYIFLYIYGYSRFSMFWNLSKDIAVLKESIYQTEVMKKELTKTLQELLEKEDKSTDIIVLSSSIKQEILKSIKDIEEYLLYQKEQLIQKQQLCQKRQNIFPYNLAKLFGTLPLCQ